MEAFAFFALIAAGFVAAALALKVTFWIVFAVALPLFWLWMLVDAIIRPAEDYPTKTTNEKILWIVLIVVFQISAAVYFFMVWRAARTREAAAPAVPGAIVPVAPAVPVQPPAV